MAKNAKGSGTIRKKTVNRNGKEYTYWEARYTVGRDPATGKQVQRSVTGKTQGEVRRKLVEAQAKIDAGTYRESDRITVGQWLTIWQDNYLTHQAPLTVERYKGVIRNHLRPALGEARLDQLTTDQVQTFVAGLLKTLSPKTAKDIAGVLHTCLDQAVESGRLRRNPADGCCAIKVSRVPVRPMEPEQMLAFLHAAEADFHCHLFALALLTGMRIGELCGLLWEDVDFARGRITVQHQLQRVAGAYVILPPKDDEYRILSPARAAMEALEGELARQRGWAAAYQGVFNNEHGLVFTTETGRNLCPRTVEKHYKACLKAAGIPDMKFHNLRHTFATVSLEAGDDIKTVQANMGHATAAFTLATYSHLTEAMRNESGRRMQQYVDQLAALESVKGKLSENQEDEKIFRVI